MKYTSLDLVAQRVDNARDLANICHRQKCELHRWVCWAKMVAFQSCRLFFSQESHADSQVFSLPSEYYLHP